MNACTHTRISVIPTLFHQLGGIFLAVNLYVLNCEQLYFIDIIAVSQSVLFIVLLLAYGLFFKIFI